MQLCKQSDGDCANLMGDFATVTGDCATLTGTTSSCSLCTSHKHPIFMHQHHMWAKSELADSPCARGQRMCVEFLLPHAATELRS